MMGVLKGRVPFYDKTALSLLYCDVVGYALRM